MREMDKLAIQPLAGDLTQADAWMRKQQTKEIATGIAGAAND
jgi:hypothetical protein